jgi:hypothetical protein
VGPFYIIFVNSQKLLEDLFMPGFYPFGSLCPVIRLKASYLYLCIQALSFSSTDDQISKQSESE